MRSASKTAPTGPTLSAPYALSYTYKRSLDSIQATFFSALNQRALLGARAKDGAVICPPQRFDPRNGDSLDELVPVGPAGTLQAWAWVDKPRPQHPLPHPFAMALVLLDGADTAMLHVVDCKDPGLLRHGLRVRPRWAAQPQGGILDLEAFVLGDAQRAAGTTPLPEPLTVTSLKTPIQLDYTITAGQTQSRFLTALTERKLLGSVDPDSGEVYVPMRPCSPVSGKPCEEIVEVAHVGEILTFCVVRIPFEGQRVKPPYVCAQILLDGADTPLFHLVGGCDVDEVKTGLRVVAQWVADAELAPTLESIKWFVPVDSAEASDA